MPWNPPSGSYSLKSGWMPVCTTLATASSTIVATATSSSATGRASVTTGWRRSEASPLGPPPGRGFRAAFASISATARRFGSVSAFKGSRATSSWSTSLASLFFSAVSSSPLGGFAGSPSPSSARTPGSPDPSAEGAGTLAEGTPLVSASSAASRAARLALASSAFSRSAARRARAASSAASSSACRLASRTPATPRSTSDPSSDASSFGSGGFRLASPAASSASAFASASASASAASAARISSRVGGGANVRLGERGYGSNRECTRGPPWSVASRWSSSSARSCFSRFSASAAARFASIASSFRRIASASSGVGFGNSAEGESGIELMEGSSAS